jgi:hypothetical protein
VAYIMKIGRGLFSCKGSKARKNSKINVVHICTSRKSNHRLKFNDLLVFPTSVVVALSFSTTGRIVVTCLVN